MKDDGLLVGDADPRRLALVIITAHQGGGVLTFTYQEDWPHADAIRFAVNYLRRSPPTAPSERPAHRVGRVRVGRRDEQAEPSMPKATT